MRVPAILSEGLPHVQEDKDICCHATMIDPNLRLIEGDALDELSGGQTPQDDGLVLCEDSMLVASEDAHAALYLDLHEFHLPAVACCPHHEKAEEGWLPPSRRECCLSSHCSGHSGHSGGRRRRIPHARAKRPPAPRRAPAPARGAGGHGELAVREVAALWACLIAIVNIHMGVKIAEGVACRPAGPDVENGLEIVVCASAGCDEHVRDRSLPQDHLQSFGDGDIAVLERQLDKVLNALTSDNLTFQLRFGQTFPRPGLDNCFISSYLPLNVALCELVVRSELGDRWLHFLAVGEVHAHSAC
mmetsp:Transcript_105666/g.309036  ORF Transcript_105666/g.309036 Transcript_105666/m.309036 type:complete len:302 (-) Transcript_105666:1148-2053(-)